MTVTEGPERTYRSSLGLSWTADGRVVPSARRRLVPLITGSSRLWGWIATLGVTAVAAFLRLWQLDNPNELLFDEQHYVKDSYSLWQFGYVRSMEASELDVTNQRIYDQDVDNLFKDTPSLIVHPELGKWLIGLGIRLFGLDPFGWRVASAIAGALMVMVLIRLVRRLTGSTLLGCTAGVLLCFDGLHFVTSRLAILDIFLAFFLLSAIACLVADRDYGRAKLAQMIDPGQRVPAREWGPVRGLRWRPWRLAAGIFFGLALASKWTAVFPLAVFGIWVLFQDAGARHMLGVRLYWLKAAVVDGIPAFFYLVVVALVVYVASWTGWIIHAHEYDLSYADTSYAPYWGDWTKHDPQGFWETATQGLRSLYHYHLTVFGFHDHGLIGSTHPYQSTAPGWPLINKPVGVEASLDIQPGDQGCAAAAGSTCLRRITLIGTPALWWVGVPAMLYAVYAWLGRRDWRFGVAVLGFVSTWFPWFPYSDRTIFYYYAVAMIPFTCIALALVIGRLIGNARSSYSHRATGAALSGAFVVLVVANFAWFWPILTDGLLTTGEWLDRVWFRSWI